MISDEFNQLKRENQQLRDELEKALKFRDMIDLMPQSFSVVDTLGNITYTNPFSFKAFGYTQEDFEKGVNVFQMVLPEEIPRVQAGIRLSAEEIRPNSEQFQALRKDGTTFSALIYTNPRFLNGQFLGFYAIVADITPQKDVEKQLRISEENLSQARAFLEAALNQSVAGVIIAGAPDLRVLQINKAAQTLLGDEGTDLKKPSWKILDHKHREISQENQPLTLAVKSGITTRNKEFLLMTSDGCERWILTNAAPVYDTNGQITAAIQVFTDLTDIHRDEAELLKIQKLESLGVLAGGIAHDFNNLLTAIMGNLSLAFLDTSETDPRFLLLKEMEIASSRAKDLTLQLLTFSNGGLPVKQEASLSALLKESSEFLARGSQTVLEFDIDPNLWKVEVDIGQFGQVIQNLIINGIQALNSRGKIYISAKNHPLAPQESAQLSEGPYVEIHIRDNGPGIPGDIIGKIFDPYFTTKKKGTGLGLAVVHSVIKKHNGNITVSSELGVGTDFCIFLPALACEDHNIDSHIQYTLEAAGNVLVMDDEPSALQVMGRMLEKIGMKAHCVTDGVQALEAFEKQKSLGKSYDFAILDLTVPGGMGGLETLVEIHKFDPRFPAMVCSGYSNDPILSNFRDYGFINTLIKPFTFEELEKAVGSIIKGRCF